MKKSLLILCLFAGYASIAQNTSVDLATGTLTLGIPLFSVHDGDVVLPGVINYSASGVRITDGDGWVGHNWSFSVEAAVTRSVRGLPDDYLGTGTNLRKGWLHGDMGTRIKNFTFTNDNNPATCSDETANWTFLNGFGYYEDTEPTYLV